jgi:uncharacterized protein YdeI (BOF family)
MKKTAFVVIACLAVIGVAFADEHPKKSEHPTANPAAAGAGGLDGKVFAAELVKAGEKSGDKDQLSFKGGKFLSSTCVAYGFHEAAYTATEKDGVITFTSNATNADGETMSWTGTIKQGVVEGTAVYKSKSGETTYTYKGTMGTGQADSDEHPKKSDHPKK